jgi:hypothetical protein
VLCCAFHYCSLVGMLSVIVGLGVDDVDWANSLVDRCYDRRDSYRGG